MGNEPRGNRTEVERVSGVSNVAYDLRTILRTELVGIAAVEEHEQDAEQAGHREALDLLNEPERREGEHVANCRGLVAQRPR